MMAPEAAEADAILLDLVRDRDEAAMGMLYDRHGRLIYSLIRRIVGEATDAEEVMQDTFLRIWDNAGTFDRSRGTALAWMVAIARRLAIDRTRSKGYSARKREVTIEAISEGSGGTTSASQESQMIDDEQRQTVAGALSILDGAHRDVIDLSYFEGLSHSRIAEQLAIPLGTVKTRIRSAMQSLRDHLYSLRDSES